MNRFEKANPAMSLNPASYGIYRCYKASLMPTWISKEIHGEGPLRLDYGRLRIFLDSCGVAMSLPNSLAILTTLSTN